MTHDDPTPAQRIAALRRHYGLSQVALARLLGVSNVTVNRWERGAVTPQAATLERIAAIERAGLDAAPRATPRPGHLPPCIGPTIGRTADRAALDVLAAAHRLVTITGPGGVGKTRLALDHAHAAPSGGVLFVDLAPLGDGAAVTHALARLLDVRAAASSPADVARHLAATPRLVVLDNCEHVLDVVAELAAAVLRAPGESRLVATSRAPLGVDGEQVLPLSPLDAADAAALFRHRAAGHGVAVADDPTGDDVVELCRRLDLLPLAIELAASRSRVLTITQMLERVDDRFELLPALERTIRWSYELLHPDAAALFRMLGIFAGRFDLAAIEAVSGRRDLLDDLDLLVRQSLVVAERSASAAGGEPRMEYRLLDSLAGFARDQLVAEGEYQAAAARHAAHHRTVAAAAARRLQSPAHLAALAELDDLYADVVAALEWTVVEHRADEAAELIAALVPYWDRSSLFAEGHRWAVRTLTLEPEPPARLQLLLALAALAPALGREDDAEAAARDALVATRRLGDRVGEAAALERAGGLHNRRNRTTEAQAAYAAALEIRTALGDRRGMAVGEIGLGNAASLGGDFAAAATHHHAALAHARATGDLPLEATILANLGELAASAGDPRRGSEYLERAITDFELLGDRDRAAVALGNSAELKMLDGDPGAAADCADRAVAQLRTSGNQVSLANMLYVRGVALAACGRIGDALASLREATAIDFERDDLTNVMYHLEAIARLHADAGDAAVAAQLLGGAQRLAEQTAAPPYEPFDHDGALDATRRRLGPAFDHEWRAGAALSTTALVNVALLIGVVTDGEPSELYKPRHQPEAPPTLTARQRAVLRLVADGRSNAQIGRQLGISARTVERHLSMIFMALGVDRRSAAVAVATTRRLL